MADLYYVTLVIHILFFLAGSVGSIFIVVVNVIDWFKKRSLITSDILVTSTGLSSLSVQCAVAVTFYCSLVSRGVYSLDQVSKTFYITRMFLFLTSLWFATWLCVYCCVKVVNLNQRHLKHFKANISEIAPWLLLGSLIFSLVLSLPAIWDISREVVTNATLGVSRNGTMAKVTFRSRCSCIFVIYIIGCSAAFFIFLFSAVLLLTSLCTHVRRMEQKTAWISSPRMDTHLRAIKIVISFLLLYGALFVSAVLIISSTLLPGDPWYVVCSLVVCTSPSLLPFILIWWNHRLLRTLKGLFVCQQHCLQEPSSQASSTG